MQPTRPILIAFALVFVLPVAVGALGLAFETRAYAQPAQTSPQPTSPAAPASAAPTLKVYSRETVVDVTVTDSKGNPVHGLARDDFTVKEDGKPQPIRSFQEFGNTTPAATPSHPKLPANVYTNLQPLASGPVNILLLDGLNTAPPDATDPRQVGWSFVIQNRVKKGAAQYLASMPTGTRVAVLGLSKSLRILQGVTSDPTLLSAAVSTMDMNMDGRATTHVEWCAMQEMRNRATIETLKQIAADAAAIKGKKNLIWFSAGFPTLTDPNTADPGPTATSVPRRADCLSDYTTDLIKTYGLLAAAQVAVYPIGARALDGEIANPVGPPNSFVDLTHPMQYGFFVGEEHLSFESMAEATGGAAFYNNNDLAALTSQAIDKGSDYYTLTYAPPGQKYNWAHHTINVAVDKPGLHLVYRKTYDAVDPATIKPTPGLTLGATPPEVRNGNMQAAMSRSMPTSQDILFDVQVEPTAAPANSNPAFPPGTILGTLDPAVKAKLKGKPLVRYGFQYAIPALQIAFSPGPNGTHKGSLELDLAAYDTDGKLVTGLSQTVKMPLSDTRYRQFIQGPFRFLQQIDLPPGQLFLRIGVLDPASNKVGTLEIPFTVAAK